MLGFQLGGTGNLSGLTGPLKQRPLLHVCFDSLLLDFLRSFTQRGYLRVHLVSFVDRSGDPSKGIKLA